MFSEFIPLKDRYRFFYLSIIRVFRLGKTIVLPFFNHVSTSYSLVIIKSAQKSIYRHDVYV